MKRDSALSGTGRMKDAKVGSHEGATAWRAALAATRYFYLLSLMAGAEAAIRPVFVSLFDAMCIQLEQLAM